MAIFESHPGSWSIFGQKLPDFGVTEKLGDVLGINRGESGGSSLITSGDRPAGSPGIREPGFSTQAQPPGGLISPTRESAAEAQQRMAIEQGQRTSGGGGGTSRGEELRKVAEAGHLNPSQRKEYEQYMMQQPQDAGPDWASMAEESYGELSAGFDKIEQAYRAEMPLTEEKIGAEYGETRGQLESAETEQSAALRERGVEAEATSVSQIAKSRQLYNELRQQRLAELSARGISSSSVAEAQMERLGRSFYGDVGTSQQNLATTQGKIQGELTKVKDFFTKSMVKLEQSKDMALKEALIKFNQGLAEIGQMRGKAGADYRMQQAQMRYDAMQNLRRESMQIQQFNATMKLDLEKWASAKQQGLSQAGQQVGENIPVIPYDWGNLRAAEGYGITGVQSKQMGGQWVGVPTYGQLGEDEEPPNPYTGQG